ncbi:MAG: GNAT family N-acetyltransferase [Pseudomonadota bacterium]
MQSERLFFRKAKESDAAFILTLLNDPDWLKYIGDRKLDSIEKSKAFITAHLPDPAINEGLGMYVIEVKSNGAAIGLCGLLQRAHMPDIDIGYALLPNARGSGFAAESVRFFISQAFDKLHYARIYAIVKADNQRSLSLIRACGFSITPQPYPGNSFDKGCMYYMREKPV